MRHNAKRPSNRNRNGQGNKNKHSRTKVYESNGPDSKIRGTAYQITEKYEILAKDAERSGNIVLAENYRQHAEHYQRIINTFEDDAPKSDVIKQDVQEELDEDLSLPASMIAEAKLEETVSA